MNVRPFLVVPAALAVAVLVGCGLNDGGSKDSGSGSARVGIHSTEVCNAPSYIRDRAPEGLCSDAEEVEVVDDLSPLQGDR